MAILLRPWQRAAICTFIGRPRCPPRLPRGAVSGAPPSYRELFMPRVPNNGSLRDCYSVPSSCCPTSTNYISTTKLVLLSKSTMKHDHKTCWKLDLRDLTIVNASACMLILHLDTKILSLMSTIECRGSPENVHLRHASLIWLSPKNKQNHFMH